MTPTRMRIFVSAAVSAAALAVVTVPVRAEAEVGLMNNPNLSTTAKVISVKHRVAAISTHKIRHARHKVRHARYKVRNSRFASLDKAVPLAIPADEQAAAAKASASVSSSAVSAAPSSLRPAIERHAAANGIPAALAAAVIKVESTYNPRAYNSGNYGLMQVRYRTARGLGYSGGPAGLFDAETNMRFGVKYLAQAYHMSGGDICRTVMRYQSGHYARSMSSANRAYCGKVRAYMARA